MKVFIYSLQREISQIISDHLTSKGHFCICFPTSSELSASLRSLNSMPDILILDYLTYNHDVFNVYDYLNKLGFKMPVIFYNDPCLLRPSRAAHWMTILETTQIKYIQKDFSGYKPLLDDLAELIESEAFKPYISLLQDPEPIPASLIKDEYTLQYLLENKDDCIYQFKERANLPNNLFYLLLTLQRNKDMLLSLKDISNLYKKEGKQINVDSLKVLISKLRKYIHEDKQCSFLIYHDKDMYRFVRFKI